MRAPVRPDAFALPAACAAQGIQPNRAARIVL